MNTIHWGMIGVVDVTKKKSAPAFSKIDHSTLVAVAGRTEEKVKAYARKNGVPKWYGKPEDLISDPEVEIVYIATPPGYHMEYALKAIEAGKHVYIEKPMGRTAFECDLINETASLYGARVYVAYYRRALDYFIHVKKFIARKKIGRILNINMQQYFPVRKEDRNRENPPWRVVKEISGGGYFHDVGCHALDILFYIFGDPEDIKGQALNVAGIYQPEDTVGVLLRLQDTIQAVCSWSFVVNETLRRDRVEVTGELGRIIFSIFSFDPIVMEVNGQMETYTYQRPEHIQQQLIESIVRELNGVGCCPSTGITAAVTNRAMDAILLK